MFRSLIKSSPFLFFCLIIYLSIFTVLILSFDKVTIFYYVNSHFNPFFDQLFYYLTAIGNGWTYAILMIAMLFFSYRYFLMFFSALIVKTIIVQSMKYFFFPGILRPNILFKTMSGLHVVNGVDLLNYYSFPSGHSASIFCIAVLLTLIIKKDNWTILFIIIAILTGYSRMYLGQHFSVDVYTGSWIGILTAYLSFWYFRLKPLGKINNISWIDKKITFSKI